jgi:hypothetical protein
LPTDRSVREFVSILIGLLCLLALAGLILLSP